MSYWFCSSRELKKTDTLEVLPSSRGKHGHSTFFVPLTQYIIAILSYLLSTK